MERQVTDTDNHEKSAIRQIPCELTPLPLPSLLTPTPAPPLPQLQRCAWGPWGPHFFLRPTLTVVFVAAARWSGWPTIHQFGKWVICRRLACHSHMDHAAAVSPPAVHWTTAPRAAAARPGTGQSARPLIEHPRVDPGRRSTSSSTRSSTSTSTSTSIVPRSAAILL